MTDKSNAIDTAMNLLSSKDDNAAFVEFSIDSDDQEDDEEGLKKFTLEDYDDDDPLGIMVNKLTEKIQETLDHNDDDEEEDDEGNNQGNDAYKESNLDVNDGADVVLNSKTPYRGINDTTRTNNNNYNDDGEIGSNRNTEQGKDGFTRVPSQSDFRMDSIPLENESDEQIPFNGTSFFNGSTVPDSKGSAASTTGVSKSDTSSALRKMTVATKEDPLSSPVAWTPPVSEPNNIAHNHVSNANNTANVTYQHGEMTDNVSNMSQPPHPSFLHGTSPHPRSNDAFVPPMAAATATSMPLFPGNVPNYPSVDSNYNSTKASGMASFVSKTHSLSSTLSSFASKFQDVVSNAANSAAIHGMNIHASAVPSKASTSTVYGHSAPVLSGPMRNSTLGSGGSSGSINGMNSLGMVRDANLEQQQQGNRVAVDTVTPLGIAGGSGEAIDNNGDQSIGMRMVSKADASRVVSTATGYKNEFQDMDNAKKIALIESAIGSLLPGEKVIMFLSGLRDVKDTSSPHTGIGSCKFQGQGYANLDEKWCCVMTFYRVIVFSFLECEFQSNSSSKGESLSNSTYYLTMNAQVDEWIGSASVSRQFQMINHVRPQQKFHQVIQMPLASIERVEKTTEFAPNSTTQMAFGSSVVYSENIGGSVANGTLTVYGKDNGRFIQFTTKSYADCMGAFKQLNTYSFPGRQNLGFLFAFESRRDEVLASVQKLDGDNTAIGRITSRATRRRYDALTEFHRMITMSPDIQCPWRPLLNVNATYSACQSYPSIVFGPATINDETPDGMRILRDIASFRSGQRFQTLSWASRYDGASLWRCAQPKVGLQGNRNVSDELYIKMIGECAALANSQAAASGKFPTRPSIDFLRMLTGGNNSSDFMLESFDRPGGAVFNEKCMLKILDLRPKSSAMANRTAGYGYENTSYYKNATLSFHGIGNIHAVRDSYQKLSALCANPNVSDVQWAQLVEETKWLSHIRLILSASWQAAFHVQYNRLPVLLHCSHGWDRTSQVCALAQIFLDPFYRTREGFSCLVEKEFLALGHPFHLRCGHGEGKGDRSNTNGSSGSSIDEGQISPIFIQFLDCVWQIVNQYPDYFEFNTKYLLIISEHVYSCRFGTLLCDTEREREVVASIRQRTHCLWEYLDSSPELLNPYYRSLDKKSQLDVNDPSFSGTLMMPLSILLRNVTLWSDRFCMHSAKATTRCFSSLSDMPLKSTVRESDFSAMVSASGTYAYHELMTAKSEAKSWKEIAHQKDSEIFALKEKLSLL
mmetsp:Transcript_4348/g.8352  ORF Transcript_4348/g.8352 Transcript_4348/m.8352 type:complete len:1261 (+) Transcript_4348:270-4052(+)